MKVLRINGKPYAVKENPQCKCDHLHVMFVKGSRKPKKLHHAHPHAASSHLGKSRYAIHKHTAALKASLRPV